MTRASLTHSSWVVGGDGVGRDVVVVSAKVLVAVRDKEDRGDNVVSEGDFLTRFGAQHHEETHNLSISIKPEMTPVS